MNAIICDVDEVIFSLSPKWVSMALKDKILFPRIRNFDVIAAHNAGKDAFIACVLNRTEYDLTKWLGLSDLAKDYFMDIYRECTTFYSDLPLTTFGTNLLVNKQAKKMIFVSHVVGGPVDDSKKEAIHSRFKNSNYAYYSVMGGFKKSDKIKEVCPEFDMFVDDCPSNILDVMSECGKPGQKFLMPMYGYNKTAPLILETAVQKTKTDFIVY
jgi:hypothetical protein